MEADMQHELNVTRMLRTYDYARKHINKDDAFMDDSFSYRSDIVTTSLYCSCDDCYKFCCYGKPIKCIDPYLMDMRYTHWIYNGLVAASKTASTRVDTNASTSTKRAARTDCDEPQHKRRRH